MPPYSLCPSCPLNRFDVSSSPPLLLHSFLPIVYTPHSGRCPTAVSVGRQPCRCCVPSCLPSSKGSRRQQKWRWRLRCRGGRGLCLFCSTPPLPRCSVCYNFSSQLNVAISVCCNFLNCFRNCNPCVLQFLQTKIRSCIICVLRLQKIEVAIHVCCNFKTTNIEIATPVPSSMCSSLTVSPFELMLVHHYFELCLIINLDIRRHGAFEHYQQYLPQLLTGRCTVFVAPFAKHNTLLKIHWTRKINSDCCCCCCNYHYHYYYYYCYPQPPLVTGPGMAVRGSALLCLQFTFVL